MGLVGFIATVVAGVIGGYVLRGKVNKKEEDPYKSRHEEE